MELKRVSSVTKTIYETEIYTDDIEDMICEHLEVSKSEIDFNWNVGQGVSLTISRTVIMDE